MIDALLFDNDGLLLDTESVFFELTRTHFAGYGIVLTEEYWAEEYLGNAKRSFEIAADLGMDHALVGPLIERRNREYRELIGKDMPVRPDVLETLQALTGRVKLAMVTGSPRDQIYMMHRESGLLDFFEVIVTEDEVEHPKPHPEPYLLALDALGVASGEALAVEDSLRGFASAHAAGIACVVVPNSLTRLQRFERAFAVEESIAGVLKHVVFRCDRTEPFSTYSL
ncbi:HAD family hydrolase [Chlorobium ferrooxidans]|uniref:HAD-superfamily hydrolase subfamily IA, variant 3 n=1 Tax=Chlorobium ferrooxidans DSM 13031 TaxID=377431 RepID=Q0YT51_9CHLB|nr:HAD family phosphatase [Chlorobium ferrooxidans]EAT59414.1 HAD-superfamily hydrolase subfamily IA, variant 3 [Chlorobium ferrooxidans DSM 13031]